MKYGVYVAHFFEGIATPAARNDILLFVFARKRSDEANSREGGFPQGIYFITLVVGYFAYAQYDVLFLFYVILNGSEESHRISVEYMLFHLIRGIFFGR